MSMDFRKEFERIWYDKKEQYVYDFELVDYTNDILMPNIKSIPPLYRYMPANYNNIRSLETQTLFLSEIGSMNDVFEGITGKLSDRDLKCLDKVSDMAYIKAFSENGNSLLMWSIYGDNYAGMCVEYDLSKMKNELLCHLFPVRYSDARNTKGDISMLYDFLKEMHRDIEDSNECADVDDAKDIMSMFLSKSIKCSPCQGQF